jgi:hypothetical protein
MSVPNINALREELTNLAKRELACEQEDFDPQDFSGGNFDDAYDEVVHEGKVELAKYLLDEYFD